MAATVAAVGLLGAGIASAQQRPNLSGTWKAAADAPPGVAAAPSPVYGPRFEIRQAADTITLIRPQREASVAAVLPLDGREARVRVTGALCQADAESVETAAWEGEALAVSVVGFIPPGGGPLAPRSVKRVFKLQAPDTLLVEGTFVQAGQAKPVATVYRRTTEPMPPPAEPPAKGPDATIAQLAWLAGTWSGPSGTSTVEERWTPAAGGSSLAVARTLRNGVMSAFEFLCIVERGGTLVYSAMPNGRSPATHFTLTAIAADAATFENPAHDYPTTVRYAKRADGALETTISGPGGRRPQSVVLKRDQ
jgi:hypothetical protein